MFLKVKEIKRVKHWCQIWTIILLLLPCLFVYLLNLYLEKYHMILVQSEHLMIIFIGVCIFVVCIYVILVYFCIIKQNKKYCKYYKEYFVLEILRQYFNNLIYKANAGISKKAIADTGAIYMGERFSSNDYISGKYKDVDFKQSDIHLEKQRHLYLSGKEENIKITYYTTLFKGRWMIFDFNKNFKANVCIYEDGFSNRRINSLFSSGKYKKVNLESSEFNSNFNVYAVDEEEAFYIITPHLMEKISKLNEACSGKLILCFTNNKLHVGLDNRFDSFEAPSYFKIFNEKEAIKSINKDAMLITMIIDELGLDVDLFKDKM